MFADSWQDLRYGLRTLGKNASFTAVVVLTLALGIGLNTAIFTMFNIFFRPLPVKDPDTLVNLEYRAGREGNRFSFPDYLYFRDHAQVFSGLIARDQQTLLLDSQSPEPQRVYTEFVSDNYFSVLGTNAFLGRTFAPDESSVAGNNSVAVLCHHFWQERFASDPNIVGKTLRINGHTFTIIGVTAEDFTGLQFSVPDIWLPLVTKAEVAGEREDFTDNGGWFGARDLRWLRVSGRLKPDQSLEEARAEADVLIEQLISAYPKTDRKESVRVVAATRFNGDTSEFWQLLGLVLGATLLVLLIACANIANLLLARAARRQKEIGMRICLGASRWRVIRQLLTESLLLAGMGGVAGLLLALWSVRLLVAEFMRVAGSGDERIDLFLAPDARVLAFTFLLSLLSGIAFGLVPALRATRANLVSIIKDEGTAFGQSLTRSWLRNGLVVAQVATCLVLLIAAGLLLQGFIRTGSIDRGYEMKQVLGVDFNFDLHGYDRLRKQQLQQELAARVASLPGVEAVSLVNALGRTTITVTGGDETAANQSARSFYSAVTPQYFETVSIPIIRGRLFTEEEMRAEAAVVVVSEAMARNLWPDEEPLGKRLKWQPDTRFAEVIGVARDVQSVRPGEIPPLFFYRPLAPEDGLGEPGLLLRTTGDLEEMKSLVRREAQALDPDLKIDMASLEEYSAGSEMMRATLAASEFASLLGLLALALAAVGLYGVMAYSVAQRTREIGIRMALGAGARDVLRLVLGQGLRLVGIGVALGLAGGMALSQLLASLIYGLSPFEPIVYAGISLFLVAVALVACYIPARRAMRVDPMVALRYE